MSSRSTVALALLLALGLTPATADTPVGGAAQPVEMNDLEILYLVPASGLDALLTEPADGAIDAGASDVAWIVQISGVSDELAADAWIAVPDGAVRLLTEADQKAVLDALAIDSVEWRAGTRLAVYLPGVNPPAELAPLAAALSVEPAGASITVLDEQFGFIPAQVEALANAAPGTGVRLGRARGLKVDLSGGEWVQTPLGAVCVVSPDLAAYLAGAANAGGLAAEGEQYVFWLATDSADGALDVPGSDDDPFFVPDPPIPPSPADEDLNRPSELDQKTDECGSWLDAAGAQAALAAQMSGQYDPDPSDIAGATTYIPMTFHVVRSTAGTGGISNTQMLTALQQANTEFAEMDICFYQQLPTRYINRDSYFTGVSGQTERDALRNEGPVANTINIYFVPNLVGLCGESSFTFSSEQGILVDNDCVGLTSNPSTFPHEVGHYFDLFHTHETAIGNECVSGLNCAIAGDLVCDTPADPGLSTGNVNTSCVYTGTATGPCLFDGRYTPQTRNIMSYSRATCRNDFTTGQNSRARSTMTNSRSSHMRSNLPTPSLALATNGTYCDKVRLEWNASSGSTSYRIYRNTANSGCGGTLLATTTSLAYNDTTATPGTTYYYSLRGVGTCGTTPCSSTNSGSRGVLVAAPTGVNASDSTSCDHVTVMWNSVSGASAYRIYRGTSSLSSSASLLTAVSASPFNDTTANPGTTYYYWVRAVGGCGEGPFSASNTGRRLPNTAPPAPASVNASDTLCQGVNLTWGSVSGATLYRIYRSTTNNSATATQIATDNASPYVDVSAVIGTTYFYWVRASTPCATSAFSLSNSGLRVAGATPAAPTGVSASDGSSTAAVNVAWTAVTGATGYKIYRGLVNDSALATQIGTDTASPFADTTAIPGVLYYYWVRANNACNTGAYSTSNAGYRALLAPTGVVATDALGAPFVTISWSAVNGATHYRVFRGTTTSTTGATALGTWQTGTAYFDSSAVPGRIYYYWVRAAAGPAGERPSPFSAYNSGRR